MYSCNTNAQYATLHGLWPSRLTSEDYPCNCNDVSRIGVQDTAVATLGTRLLQRWLLACGSCVCALHWVRPPFLLCSLPVLVLLLLLRLQTPFNLNNISSLMTEMDQYWPSLNGANSDFWSHEYTKRKCDLQREVHSKLGGLYETACSHSPLPLLTALLVLQTEPARLTSCQLSRSTLALH